MNYFYITILTFFFVFLTIEGQGQETPLLKNHDQQALLYNPAFAGSKGHLTMNMSQKIQSTATNGNIISQFFTLHAPVRYTKISLGMSLIHQRVNNMSEVKIAGDYAYNIELGFYTKLTFGLSGVLNCCAKDFESLKKIAVSDDVTTANTHGSLSGDAGVGVQYTSDYFFAGLSMPSLIQTVINRNNTSLNSEYTEDLYLTLGTNFLINNKYKVKVNGLLKSTNYASSTDMRIGLEYDLSAKLVIYEALIVGASYRSSSEYQWNDLGQNAIGFNIGYYFSNNTQLELSFETPLVQSSEVVSQNSLELIASYSVPYKKETLLTPRYFF